MNGRLFAVLGSEKEKLMSNLWKDHRLPLVISGVALLIATLIGLVPLYQDDGNASPQLANDLSTIEDRLAALEREVGTTSSTEIPPNADNQRLRQEIDLITRGLGNQTGRVSRLKDAVEGIVDANGQVIAPQRVLDEIALAKRGLSNLTRRINNLAQRLDTLDTASADIARLQQQMVNVDRAMGRLAASTNLAKDERAQIFTRLGNDNTSAIQSTSTLPASSIDQLETKLDEILERLND
jgi:chromosome segregation ATPase